MQDVHYRKDCAAAQEVSYGIKYQALLTTTSPDSMSKYPFTRRTTADCSACKIGGLPFWWICATSRVAERGLSSRFSKIAARRLAEIGKSFTGVSKIGPKTTEGSSTSDAAHTPARVTVCPRYLLYSTTLAVRVRHSMRPHQVVPRPRVPICIVSGPCHAVLWSAP